MNPAQLWDRGLTLGDGLFETLLWRDGALVDVEAHWDRLARGCTVLGLPKPATATLDLAARQAIHDAGLAGQRAFVRLMWTAGEGRRGLDRPDHPTPRMMVIAGPAPEPLSSVALATVSVRRNEGSPSSRIKSLSYLDNVLARREAVAVGADEALMLNARGEVACAAAANVFWFEGDRLVTPSLECGVLDGTVRARVLGRAQEAGIEIAEVRAEVEALASAAGIFLTNSLTGVQRVSSFGGRAVTPHPLLEALAV